MQTNRHLKPSKKSEDAKCGAVHLISIFKGDNEKVEPELPFTLPEKCRCDAMSAYGRQFYAVIKKDAFGGERLEKLPLNENVYIISYNYRSYSLIQRWIDSREENYVNDRIDNDGYNSMALQEFGGIGPSYGPPPSSKPYAAPQQRMGGYGQFQRGYGGQVSHGGQSQGGYGSQLQSRGEAPVSYQPLYSSQQGSQGGYMQSALPQYSNYGMPPSGSENQSSSGSYRSQSMQQGGYRGQIFGGESYPASPPSPSYHTPPSAPPAPSYQPPSLAPFYQPSSPTPSYQPSSAASLYQAPAPASPAPSHQPPASAPPMTSYQPLFPTSSYQSHSLASPYQSRFSAPSYQPPSSGPSYQPLPSASPVSSYQPSILTPPAPYQLPSLTPSALSYQPSPPAPPPPSYQAFSPTPLVPAYQAPPPAPPAPSYPTPPLASAESSYQTPAPAPEEKEYGGSALAPMESSSYGPQQQGGYSSAPSGGSYGQPPADNAVTSIAVSYSMPITIPIVSAKASASKIGGHGSSDSEYGSGVNDAGYGKTSGTHVVETKVEAIYTTIVGIQPAEQAPSAAPSLGGSGGQGQD